MPAGGWRALVLLAAAGTAGAADDLAGALGESRFYGFAKAMYVADDKKGGRLDQETPGFGGKLGVQSGAWQGFSLRGAWYLTSDLGLRHDDARQTDAFMFDVDKKPYGLLGEAQLRYDAGRTSVVLGRQEFNSPLINSYDYRIVPNLFEAYTVRNRDLPGSTLTFAYVARMAGLDGLVSFSRFRSMAQQLYPSLKLAADGSVDTAHGSLLDASTVAGQGGVWVAGGELEGAAGRYRLWNFYGVGTVNMLYGDTRWQLPLSPSFDLAFETQAYRVGAVGQLRDYLGQRGLNANYDLLGLRATLSHRPSGVSLAGALNRFGGNAQTMTVFSSWGGYPEFVPMPYIYAENNGISGIVHSRLARATLHFDLASCGLAGHSLLLGRARINLDDAILAASDAKVSSLLYRAQLSAQWSARLSVDIRQSHNSRHDNKFATLAVRYDY